MTAKTWVQNVRTVLLQRSVEIGRVRRRRIGLLLDSALLGIRGLDSVFLGICEGIVAEFDSLIHGRLIPLVYPPQVQGLSGNGDEQDYVAHEGLRGSGRDVSLFTFQGTDR